MGDLLTINPGSRLDLLVALQNLAFLMAAARANDNDGLRQARRLFSQLAQLELPLPPTRPLSRPVSFIASEQVFIAVPPARA